MAVDQDSQPWW